MKPLKKAEKKNLNGYFSEKRLKRILKRADKILAEDNNSKNYERVKQNLREEIKFYKDLNERLKKGETILVEVTKEGFKLVK